MEEAGQGEERHQRREGKGWRFGKDVLKARRAGKRGKAREGTGTGRGKLRAE